MNVKGFIGATVIGFGFALVAYLLGGDGWFVPIIICTIVIALLILTRWQTQIDVTETEPSVNRSKVDPVDPNKDSDNLSVNVTNMFKN